MRWPRRRRRAGAAADQPPPGTLWAIGLETTGLDPDLDHIVEIGMVPVVERRIRLGRAWSTCVRPPAHGGGAIVVAGVMPPDLEAAPEPSAVAEQLWTLVGHDALLVHHALLDLSFLRRLQESIGRPWPEPTVIDTVDLLFQRNRDLRRLGQPELPLQLGGARQALGLPPIGQHRALADAAATAELWLALTGRQAAGIDR